MLDKIKKIILNKKVLIGLAALILVAVVVIIIFNLKKVTKLERIKIEEKSKEISDYFSEITENEKDEGRYVNFAIEYLYNVKNKDTFTIKEIIEVIEDNFDIKYDEKKIAEMGITASMHAKGVTYDSSISSFKYEAKRTATDISADKIIYFKINKIKKINKNEFKVTYDKYVIENPFDILNYYNNYNIEHFDKKEDQYSTKPITEYLKGNGKIGTIKKIAREETKTTFGKVEKKVPVTYIIKEDKLMIKSINK